jgi:hypothetical protein
LPVIVVVSDKRPTNSELRIAKLIETAKADRPGLLIIFEPPADAPDEAADTDRDTPLGRDPG